MSEKEKNLFHGSRFQMSTKNVMTQKNGFPTFCAKIRQTKYLTGLGHTTNQQFYQQAFLQLLRRKSKNKTTFFL